MVDYNDELINFTNEVLYGLLLDGLFINVEAVDGESTAEINYQAATSENDLIRFNTSYSVIAFSPSSETHLSIMLLYFLLIDLHNNFFPYYIHPNDFLIHQQT